MDRVSYTTFVEIIVLLVAIVAAIGFFSSFSLDDPWFASTDSIHYHQQALGACDSPLEPLRRVLDTGSPINLNWGAIVSIVAIACYLSGEYSDVLVLVTNLILFSGILFFYRKVLDNLPIKPSNKRIIIILFLAQTWLITSLVGLNKEVFSYIIVGLMALCYLRRSVQLLLLVGLIGGVVKVQFFVFALMLIVSQKGVSFKSQFFVLAILMTVIYQSTNFDIFDAHIYYSRFDYEIRTAKVAEFLNKFIEYPFGYLLVFPVRLVINLLSGLSPMRISEVNNWNAFAYQFNAFIMSIPSILLLFKLINHRSCFAYPLVKFFLIYSLLMCLLPFFQLRYFLPLLPIILIILATPSPKIIGQEKGSSVKRILIKSSSTSRVI